MLGVAKAFVISIACSGWTTDKMSVVQERGQLATLVIQPVHAKDQRDADEV
ncbi:MAG: hypothetical protein RLY70_2733 [Planctomycetota bacterium]|jgi:hypothetical protein